MIIVLMGVTGSGKTTIGRMLADALDCPFYDSDDFHSSSHKEKMGKGIPLTDEDRLPWLKLIRAKMGEWEKAGPLTVLVCSALKQSYRDLLSNGIQVQWVYLKGDRETIEGRIEARQGHFAGSNLLESQIAALEEPAKAFVVDVRKNPKIIVGELIQELKGNRP